MNRNKRGKVIVITPAKFPGSSGDTANYSEIISQLTAFGYEVVLICPTDPQSKNGKYETTKTFRVVRVPIHAPTLKDIRNNVSISSYIRLLLFITLESLIVFRHLLTGRKLEFVLIRHSIFTITLPFLLNLIGIKMIADGELISDSLKSQLSKGKRLILFNFEKRAIKKYSMYKVSTSSQVENLVNLGLPKERIKVIPVSIDLSKVPIFSLEEIPQHTFGYFGVLEEWQGVDILIEAHRIVVQSLPNAKLYIVGTGSLYDQLNYKVRKYNLSNNIIFVGPISREKLWEEYFRKFRIVVIPRPKFNNSIDSLLPIKLIESLAAGKPVIAVSISAMRELPADSILLIDESTPHKLANAMQNLSTDTVRMSAQAKNALEAAKPFDIRTNIRKFLEI